MPRKAFLHKKSLLDQFKDDYKSTGYIQSARAEHTWSNPLTRRKRTNKLNGWIKSFQGKRHVHKLARFNAMQAGKNEDYADGVRCLRYGSSFELPDGKIITALDKAIRCRRSGAFIVYITGWVENGSNDPSGAKYTVYFDSGKFSDYFLTNNIQDLPNYQTNGPIPSDNKVVKDYAMHENTNEAMSLKGFLENLTEKLTKQFDLDAEDVKFYLDTHTQEMQELLDDKELSLKEKVLFVRDEITSEKDEAKKDNMTYVLSCKVGPDDITYCKNKYGAWTDHIEDAWEGSGPDSFTDAMKQNFADSIGAEIADLEIISFEKFESKQSESLVLPNPTIIYRGTSEDAKKASHYISKILADKGLGWGRVGWRSPKNGEFHYGHPEKNVYTVYLRGSNDLIKDSFEVYRDAYGNEFWNNCDASPDGWVNPSEIPTYIVARKSESLFNKREMERITLSEGSKVSPYLVEIAHKILKDEYGWKASTLEEVADWLGDHKQAFEHAYGQALRSSNNDKANVKAGIEAALDEEEQGVMNAEIAMMGESKKQTNEMIGNKKWVIRIKRLGKNYYVCSSSFRVNKAFRYPSLGGPFVCSDWDITERDIAKYDNYNDAKKAWDSMAQALRGGLPFYKEGEDYEIVQVNFSMMGESKKHEGFNTTRDLDNFALHILNYIKDKTHYPGYVRFVKLNDDEEDFYGKYFLSVNGKNYYLYVGDTDYSITDNNDENTLVEGSTDLSGAMNKDLDDFCERIQQPFYTESKEPAEEKLGYEKGHKNSKGEDAPWVIRSHKDNRILASFATENKAKEHMKRMKQYSKQEAYVDNSATAQKDYVERVISAVQDYYGYSLFDAKNLVQRNAQKVKDWYMSGEVSDVEAARCLGGNCEPTKKESKDDATDLEEYTSCVLSDLVVTFHYGKDGAKKLIEQYSDLIRDNYVDGDSYAYETARAIAKSDGNKYAQEEAKKSEKKSEADSNKDVFTIDLYRIDDDGEEERLDDMQASQMIYDEDEAIKVANELADSYADGDGVVFAVVMAGERQKPNGDIVGEPFDIHWASSGNPEKTAEYRKKAGYAAFDNAMDYYAKQNESKKSEGIHLDFEDTIQVPEWLWKAYMLNDTTDLEEDEIEKLNDFREKYKDYHLDDKSEDPYFSSRNDFDELGGNVYDVDVYKMSDEPTEKKSESKNEALKDFPDGANYKFTFGFHSPKTANIAKDAAEKNGYVAISDKDNNVSFWTKVPQDAIRFADTTVNLANEDERTKLERSDVDKAFAIAVTNKGYSENKETIDNSAAEYAVVVHPFESFDGFSVMGELTDVVDFLESVK